MGASHRRPGAAVTGPASPSVSRANPPEPYAIHDGLAVYRVGDGSACAPDAGSASLPDTRRRQRHAAHRGLDSPWATGDLVRSAGRRDDRTGRCGCRCPRCTTAPTRRSRSAASPGPVDAVGHSMGGLAVLAYTIERPERVRRLVLIGTGTGGRAYMTAPGALWNRSHPQFWRLAALGILQMVWRRRAPEKILNDFIHRQSFVDQGRAGSTSLALGDWLRPRGGHTEWHRIASRLDYGPRLCSIRRPTLILCGRHDPQYARLLFRGTGRRASEARRWPGSSGAAISRSSRSRRPSGRSSATSCQQHEENGSILTTSRRAWLPSGQAGRSW